MSSLAAVLFTFCVLTAATPLAGPPGYGGGKAQSWPGWPGISHMFVFSDSYTTTGFEVNGTQPSAANPFGNPPYPGYTSSNGPNWIDFLTTTYNQSFVKTINLAYGGATIDGALIPAYLPTVLSVKQQVNDEYIPTYAGHPEFFDWRSKDTLFAIFIGINDIGNAYGWSNSLVVFDKVIAEYAGLVVSRLSAPVPTTSHIINRTSSTKRERRTSSSSTSLQSTDRLSPLQLARRRSPPRRRR